MNDSDADFYRSQVASLERALRALANTTRDEYARAALTGLLAYGYSPRELVVEEAFKIADVAMEQRK
jgi:hypothetical protein